MGKRSDFPRFPQDKYDTPLEAVMPLLEHLKPHTQFIEPCAGDGYLIGHLKRAEHVCIGAYDLPSHDARVTRYAVEGADAFISNTPWRVDIMHPIIANLSDQAPAWLLLYSDWLFTKQAIPFLPRLRDVVAIGRVRWIPIRNTTEKTTLAGANSAVPIRTPQPASLAARSPMRTPPWAALSRPPCQSRSRSPRSPIILARCVRSCSLEPSGIALNRRSRG